MGSRRSVPQHKVLEPQLFCVGCLTHLSPFGTNRVLDSVRFKRRRRYRSLVWYQERNDTDQSVVVSDRKIKGGHPTYKKKNSCSTFVVMLFGFYRKKERLL